MKKILSLITMLVIAMTASADLAKKAQGGWFESCWMEFTGLSSSYDSYKGYVQKQGGSWVEIDGKLLRSYGSYGRVDALGLTAGTYKLKVVPFVGGAEQTALVSDDIEVKNFDRSGFAHFNYSGVGAYNNDGTLKSGAKVFYVTSKTAKTITTDVVTSDKGAKTTCTGMQSIIAAYEKGYDKTPIAFRIVGTVNAEDMDYFGSKEEGLQIKGRKSYSELNITIEGVGNDAVIYGFGLFARNTTSLEIRNVAIKTGMDDGISLDTDNSHVWIHNVDVFYGPNKGGDQKKGDGAIDVKGNSQFVTISYVHFWDTGKSTMCGMKSESGPNYITYHHNWFDHSDSRHARIRTMSVHMYNNYYDGIAKYGAGATTGASLFMDRNYFRACSKPMMISLQGADTKYGQDYGDAPTFSGETGGIIKSYGNKIVGTANYKPYSSTNKVDFDCYEVNDPNTPVPADVTTRSGGNKYNNFDTNGSMYTTYAADAAEDVPTKVTDRTWGAGRCQGGDFEFTFTAADDASYDINTALEAKLAAYKTASKFKGFLGEGEVIIPDASASFTLDGAAISFNNLTYTKSLPSADTQASFEVVVTPAEAEATVSVEGASSAGANTFVIAAPAAGATATATFTIRHLPAEMKYTIIIDKTKAEPTPEDPTLDGSTIVYFEAKNPACDNADVSQLIKVTSANYSTSKGTKTYKGANYGECMKMESSTVFTLTATDPCTITLVADVANKNIKVDDVAYKTDSNGCYTFTAVAGKTYTIKKGDSMNLFAIDFEPTATAVQNISAATSANASAVAKKIADGRLIIEANGKQFNAAGAQIK
jgi:pectate lyase